MSLEILVKRSSISNRLYDVVQVDFDNESYEMLERSVEFEDAVGLAEYYKEQINNLV